MSRRLGAVVLLVAVGCKREAATHAGGVASAVDAGSDVGVDAARAVVACGAMEPVVPDAEGMAFLPKVVGTVHVELSEAPTRFAPHDVRREKVSPTATITAVVFKPYKLVNDERVPLTAGDLDRVIFRGSVLRLRSFGKVVEHTASDCVYTLRDLVEAIEATDLRTRGDNPWMEGINLHHVHFHGLSPSADGAWRIGWAS